MDLSTLFFPLSFSFLRFTDFPTDPNCLDSEFCTQLSSTLSVAWIQTPLPCLQFLQVMIPQPVCSPGSCTTWRGTQNTRSAADRRCRSCWGTASLQRLSGEHINILMSPSPGSTPQEAEGLFCWFFHYLMVRTVPISLKRRSFVLLDRKIWTSKRMTDNIAVCKGRWCHFAENQCM